MQIPRKLETILRERMAPGKVNVVYGARRVGKTHLLKKIYHELKTQALWLNGELTEVQELLSSKNLNIYQRLISNNEVIFIDEAQEVPEVGKSLKIIVDEFPSIKVVASGSSAFDLGNNLGEPLVGRAFWHKMYPISQQEFSSIENLVETRQNLEERLIYGSYPEVSMLNTFPEKEEYLLELSNSYLLKDIISFDGIRNSAKVFDLLKLVAYQIGKEVSSNELGKQLGMSKNTVEKYLDLLEKVFVLKKITAFSRNLRKEVSKSPRWFFIDNGIRNAVINNFRFTTERTDKGELWENYLFLERLKKNHYSRNQSESYFWRTYDQQEIDCVEVKGDQIDGYEFKWKQQSSRVPAAFAKAYPSASFTTINPSNYLDFID